MRHDCIKGIIGRLSIGVAALVAISGLTFFLCPTFFFLCKDVRSEEAEPRGETASPEHAHTNRLIHETSPYLRQHAHNPVNWYPWGDEAFEKAKKEGKAVFLSVGYSTCYWCHVMERQSFENPDVAEILNKHFVAIKVDREERPDVDEQYMMATQLLTRRGGWPNSVWLTPDGQPWMAGTYFPPENFKRVLLRLADLWQNRRADMKKQAEQLTAAIRRIEDDSGRAENGQAAGREVDQKIVDQAIRHIRGSFDGQHGGFGTAPKFPPHGDLRLLIHAYRRNQDPGLYKMVDQTLDAMARGGVRDHVGGGFHRYSTDRQWLLPHFEKMLYDNAQLMRIYTDGYLLTQDERYRQVVEEIFAWLQREMADPDGGFYSAIDSETEGEEGKFYTWQYDEVLEILGPQRGRRFAAAYGFDRQGNFTEEATGHRTGTNIPYLPMPLAQFAREQGLDNAALRDELAQIREQLLTARDRRPRPHRDDKILASWNGLMIESLAYAGRQFQEPKYVEAAREAAEFILANMTSEDGHVLRTYRNGQARLPGYLDDYAFLAVAFLELHASTSEPQWLQHAQRLVDILHAEFQDQQQGGFFFTAQQHDDLLIRSKHLLSGGNVPSGNGVAAQALLQLGRLTKSPRYSAAGRHTLESLAVHMHQMPQSSESLILAVAMHLSEQPGSTDDN